MSITLATLLSMVATCQAGAGEARDRSLDAEVTREAQRILDRLDRIAGQSSGGRVHASVDLATSTITLEFGRDLIPQYAGADFEHQMDLFRHGVTEAVRKYTPPGNVEYKFDGRAIMHYFPEQQQEDADARRRGIRGSGMAMVSAAHGYYRHQRKAAWLWQRPLMNDVREDLVTPAYAEELKHWIQERGRMPVVRPRTSSFDLHEESGVEWWQVAAKYHLEERFPANPEIWNSPVGDSNRDYDQDLRSRPLLANHLGADVALHLHTNGSDSEIPSGTRVVYQTGREEDRALARSVLCYMRELITGQDDYSGFNVESDPRADNKGENRIANMASIIIETAFHSNPNDALALQDPVFREASMKGVEKGYRLWREGKGCDPLKVDPIQTIRVAAGQSRVVDLAFAGFPQYPVVIETKNLGCPPGWKCTDGAVTLPDADTKPAQITLRCENAGSAPIYWDTRMVDDDGVKSPPVRHIVQCVRGPGMVAPQATHGEDGGAATARKLP
ncbi:N-acetylmuramoyl-L-alanine amidase [Stenotrophomonas sp. CFBP 13724]|uniref:N-acetylmuramoyl-L-alanine amidase family protein n=1 Tax=Stenotrophomonas sp. CFBP 13724 TaxID=2775298 RepID=UPI0020182EE9|nr:N-acetylmuramoyl-L-alanine amidase [Stenotrophomonas sp. CFBP 13724]